MIPKEALGLSSAGSKGACSAAPHYPRMKTRDIQLWTMGQASAETSRLTMSRMAASEIAAVSSVAGGVPERVSSDIRAMQREQPCQPQCQVSGQRRRPVDVVDVDVYWDVVVCALTSTSVGCRR